MTDEESWIGTRVTQRRLRQMEVSWREGEVGVLLQHVIFYFIFRIFFFQKKKNRKYNGASLDPLGDILWPTYSGAIVDATKKPHKKNPNKKILL